MRHLQVIILYLEIMCDTFVYVPSTPNAPIYFGKNSDREPNEAQAILYLPSGKRKLSHISTTYTNVGVSMDCNAVLMSKPFQMWGAEMGVNEYGVTIGNEAVFTKVKIKKKNTGLTGMDLLRLALEIATTAKEALYTIIEYLEKYGQQACGGYTDKNFYYHNSFIIADSTEAYVLETAGKHWVYQKVKGYRAISNGLTIEDSYDGISKDAIAFARKKGWSKKIKIFNFKKAFSTYLMPKLAASEVRKTNSENVGKPIQSWSFLTAAKILRQHGTEDFHLSQSKTNSICMHATGLLCPHQTTGSLIAILTPNQKPRLWLTASSSPCLSLFKPISFEGIPKFVEHIHQPSEKLDNSYWWQWEAFNRQALKVYQELIVPFKTEQTKLEEQWYFESLKPDIVFEKFSAECWQQSIDFLNKWEKIVGEKTVSKSHFFYDLFWKKQNKAVSINLQK